MPDLASTDTEGGLVSAILAHAETNGACPALTSEGVTLSWAELDARVRYLSGAVAAEPADAQRPIALAAMNSVDSVIAYLAIAAAGRCVVPLPVSASAEIIRGMLADCEPQLIFADSTGLELIGTEVPRRTVVLGNPSFSGKVTPLAVPITPNGETDFNIIYSSGTTARPKGIVHSHAMRYRQAARAMFGIGTSSTILLATPIYSNTTLMPLLATLFHGGHVVLMRKFDARNYLDLAERYRATHTMLVPVQYQRLIAEPSFATRILDTFQLKQSTGAPMAADLKRKVLACWPGRLLEVFGLTEGGCTCILDVGAAPDKAHTVGRPAAGNDIRVIDEAGHVLPRGEVGEVVGRSPTMMTRYFRNPEETEAFYWYDATGNRFHRTGDIGRFDEDGYLTLLDRKKDVIISGGFNIYASDLERALLAHPDVCDAAVIGIPSDKWGETPLGFAVLQDGVSTSADTLLEWANGQLGKMQRMSGLVLRASLPRSAAGKVLKQELRKPYWMDRNL